MAGANPFLPSNAKTYMQCLDTIDAGDLYEGLLGYGFFADRLPPIFSSLQFARHMASGKGPSDKAKHDWVKFRYKRDVGTFREFGIPHPVAYANLVEHLFNHWDDLKQYFAQHTQGQGYRRSRLIPRKLAHSHAVFEMNYKDRRYDSEPLPALLVGMRYQTKCDISQCFPSVYTHALEWALIGKQAAKGQLGKGNNKTWEHKLDVFAQNTTFGETHGLLIGPHASNLLAEIILTRVDETLVNKGHEFVRYIDDYECYSDSYEAAQRFIVDLDEALAHFRLSLNQRKTRIAALPDEDMDSWVRSLTSFAFKSKSLSPSEVDNFLSRAIRLAKSEQGSAACINYALRMLKGRKLSYLAERRLASMGAHLLCLYPYLNPSVDEHLFQKCSMTKDEISYATNLMYEQCQEERDYLSCCYALYFAVRYEFAITKFDCQTVRDSGDCLLMLFGWLYAKENSDQIGERLLHDHAAQLYANGCMDQYWLFVYEVLDYSEFSNGDEVWRNLKKNSITFIDSSNLLPAKSPSSSQRDLLAALSADLEDDISDDDPDSGCSNVL